MNAKMMNPRKYLDKFQYLAVVVASVAIAVVVSVLAFGGIESDVLKAALVIAVLFMVIGLNYYAALAQYNFDRGFVRQTGAARTPTRDSGYDGEPDEDECPDEVDPETV